LATTSWETVLLWDVSTLDGLQSAPMTRSAALLPVAASTPHEWGRFVLDLPYADSCSK
jgi:hypothetical protein